MRPLRKASLVLQSLLYVAAGVNHFWHTATYTAIMPPHWHRPVFWILLTGLLEILGGIGLLVPQTRRWAAWGIIAMLLVYFDVHVYMLAHHADRFQPIPVWALWLRLPLQFVLIGWAWIFTRRHTEGLIHRM